MRPVFAPWLFVLVAVAAPGGAQQIDLAKSAIIDLTHPLNAQTLYWPTAPSRFKLEKLAYGPTPGGWFYSAYTFSAPEHGGTHLDAPIHFAEHGFTADKVPLERLVARAVVIDVSDSAARDMDYRLSVADVEAFERRHGRIAPRPVGLLPT